VISGKVRKKVWIFFTFPTTNTTTRRKKIIMDVSRVSITSWKKSHYRTVQKSSCKVDVCDSNTKMLHNFIYRNFAFMDFNDKISPLVHLKTHKNISITKFQTQLLLMEEVLNNHQGYKETCKYWDKLQNINW